MSAVSVLVPVLGRPERVAPLLDSLDAVQDADCPAAAMFLCSPGDDAQIAAVEAAGLAPVVVPWAAGPGDYARKINLGVLLAAQEWLFLGADDLAFRPGWIAACLAAHAATGACVIGTNDDGNPQVKAGQHATHSLVHRDYLECGTVDAAGRILTEAYDHNFVDNEYVATARWRGTFAFAADAVVEHLHPHWGKGELDPTYVKGQLHFEEDRQRYAARRRLWGA